MVAEDVRDLVPQDGLQLVLVEEADGARVQDESREYFVRGLARIKWRD